MDPGGMNIVNVNKKKSAMQDSGVKIVLNRNCVTTDPLETETGFMNMSLNRSHGIRHSSDIFAKTMYA